MLGGLKKAIDLAEDFAEELSEEDFAEAIEYLHPDCNMSLSAFSSFINSKEESLGVDFSQGVTLEGRVSMRNALHDSDYGGSVYEFEYRASIGEKSVYALFVIVDNEQGYGIYNFDLAK